MQIVSDIKTLSQKVNIAENNFPVFYQNKDISFFLSDHTVIPFLTHRNYFLKICKVEFYPLKNNERLSAEEEKKVLNIFVNYIKQKKIADRITQPANYVIFNTVPENASWCKFGTYQINLSQTEEQLWRNVHSKHKNVIRNAEKNNVKLKYGELQIENFHLLYRQTMERSNMYCEDILHFKKMYQTFPKNTICGVAYYKNIPQGALFMPYSMYGVYYLYGASAEKIEVNGVMNFLHWNTIKLLKQQNVMLYDFVGARLSDVSGTKLEGIQKFKERFGGELKIGYLWKIDINKTKCFVYDFLLKTKLKLNGNHFPKDIIDQENEKQKRLTHI